MSTNHILIIGTVWPEPNSSAAGSRMLQLIELFLAQQWEITFASPAAESQHAIDLDRLGIQSVTIEVNDSAFDSLIKELRPSIVLFDRFMTEEQFGWRVLTHCPGALRILNTEDLHCLRKTRQEVYKANQEFSDQDVMTRDITKREIASIYRSDLTLIISEFEMNLLQQKFKVSTEQLLYVPFLLDPITSKQKKEWSSFEERRHFITIGNFRHDPNWDSILYLKEVLWPLIRKELPDAKLHIYGAYPPPKATQLHQANEGFLIQGWAENSQEVMQNARICLAPLRFGAGLKGKLIESMCCGTPSISTTIGAEGMHDTLPWNGIIVDDPKQFARAAVQLYLDQSLWNRSQLNGMNIINTRFQKEKFSSIAIRTILTTQKNLNKYRMQNFIGSMLNFHTMRSTEFMSRWIEEKNK